MERVESDQRLHRPLIELARAVGLSTSYVGQNDDYHEIEDEVLVAALKSLGFEASDARQAKITLKTLQDARHRELIEPTVFMTAGETSVVPVHAGVWDIPEGKIILENGEEYPRSLMPASGDGAAAYPLDDGFVVNAALELPADLPVGYHRLIVTVGEREQTSTLICAPRSIPWAVPEAQIRPWGWMAQLYSIRSRSSWGVGDFADLAQLLVQAKGQSGADFVLVNPMHAAEPVSPLTPSPYLPVSRRLVNFTYIRPQAIQEYQLLGEESLAQVKAAYEACLPLNDDSDHIDRDTMWKHKMRALWLIYKLGRSVERQSEFAEYVATCGDDLEAYATWCLAYDKWGAPSEKPDSWVNRFGKDSGEIKVLREQYPDTLDFYRWMEWVATQQLDEAQRQAEHAGMRIGVMSDMAVGVHPQGAEVWWNPDRYVKGVTVGAPPDYFNQQGQNWSQPPLNPVELERTGYLSYRNMVHGMFAHAGALRIDHILGLFRLWWIPAGMSAVQGVYVNYRSEAMLGILAIEASRVNGIVVGEDLGVVPQYVADSLIRHEVLGCVVEWFEQRNGKFRAPSQWRECALASVNTHDMPPDAGYLNYEHVELHKRLGLLTGSAEDFMASAVAEQKAMMSMLVEGGFLNEDQVKNRTVGEQQIVEAQYKALTASSCKLLAAALTDGVGERRAQNQPGTNNEYPNWRIPLGDSEAKNVLLEDLFTNKRLQSLAAIMRTA
jgi:4-alpha-glucanotransferase